MFLRYLRYAILFRPWLSGRRPGGRIKPERIALRGVCRARRLLEVRRLQRRRGKLTGERAGTRNWFWGEGAVLAFRKENSIERDTMAKDKLTITLTGRAPVTIET